MIKKSIPPEIELMVINNKYNLLNHTIISELLYCYICKLNTIIRILLFSLFLCEWMSGANSENGVFLMQIFVNFQKVGAYSETLGLNLE